jgi:hypothetical protein
MPCSHLLTPLVVVAHLLHLPAAVLGLPVTGKLQSQRQSTLSGD